MRAQAIESIIHQDPRPTNTLELCYMLDYSVRLGVILGTRCDPRFDPLSPPPNLFDDFPLGFTVTFRTETFEIASADRTKTVAYGYDRTVAAFIESLEAGLIDRELATLLRKHLHVDAWEEGHVLCQITDFRLAVPVDYRQMLRLTDAAILGAIGDRGRPNRREPGEADRRAPSLETERQTLAITRPCICLDPSPDVARVQSAVDWRRQMWRRKSRLEKEQMVVTPPPPPMRAPPGNITLKPLAGPVVIPDAIYQVLASGGRAPKAGKGE
jgi:hypothetical protein